MSRRDFATLERSPLNLDTGRKASVKTPSTTNNNTNSFITAEQDPILSDANFSPASHWSLTFLAQRHFWEFKPLGVEEETVLRGMMEYEVSTGVSSGMGDMKKASPKIRLFLLRQLGLSSTRESLSEEELGRMIPESKVKEIERQARLDHPKVWNRIVSYCNVKHLKEFLDENIKLIQKDEKTPQLSEPWVAFCKDELFPAVAGDRQIRFRTHAPEAEDEEDLEDDTLNVAPQSLVESVMNKGLDWFKGKVANSERIKSTPAPGVYRYFNNSYLHKVADRIFPPVKRGIGQRGRGKNPMGGRIKSEDGYEVRGLSMGNDSGIQVGVDNDLYQAGALEGDPVIQHADMSNPNPTTTSSSSSSSSSSAAGVEGGAIAGSLKRKAGRKKGDSMAETSRDPKEVDKSLNLMVNNYLIGTERVLGKKDLHHEVTTSLVDQEPELEPEGDIDMNESPSQRDQLKTLIMQQKNDLIESMHRYADELREEHTRSSIMFVAGMAPSAHKIFLYKVANHKDGQLPSEAAKEMFDMSAEVVEAAALVPSRIREREKQMNAKRQKLTHKRRSAGGM